MNCGDVMRRGRLRWHGRVERKDNQVDGGGDGSYRQAEVHLAEHVC